MSDAATLNRAVPKPVHIPESAVYHFDMFYDPAEPHERIREMVKTARLVFWTPRNSGPEHGQYRAPLQQAFSPKAMLALQDDIRALTNQVVWDV